MKQSLGLVSIVVGDYDEALESSSTSWVRATSGATTRLIDRAGGVDAGYVRTYHVYMNVTLSIDEEILLRVRELAARRGTSVNQMIREYLSEVAGEKSSQALVDELDELWGAGSSESGGRGWTREELHERGRLR